MANAIKVERELFETKEGKKYFAYYINATVRNTEVKVQVVPPDLGGYKVLEIVYNGEKEAEFVVTPYRFEADDGHIIEGNTFKVVTTDENGQIYECPVQPARKSDKSLLDMLIRENA